VAQQGGQDGGRTNHRHMGPLAARYQIWWIGEGEGSGAVVFRWFHLQEQSLREGLFNSLGLREH